MIISSARLLDFVLKALGPLPSSGYKIRVQRADGSLFKLASPDEVAALAEEKQVIGKGSEARLKFTTLTVDDDQALATLSGQGERRKNFGARIPIAQDNFTVRRVNEPTGQYFEHRNDICANYAR